VITNLEKICDSNYKKDQLKKSYGKNWVVSGAGKYLSSWNKEYHKRIIEFWSKEFDIILDPFAGHSSSFLPFLMNRNFIFIIFKRKISKGCKYKSYK